MRPIFKHYLLFPLIWVLSHPGLAEDVLDLLEERTSPTSTTSTLLLDDGTYLLPDMEVIGEYVEEDSGKYQNAFDPEEFGNPGTDLLRFGGASTTTLAGAALQQNLRATLGDTLASQPGVTASSYSPGVSRPVIRGFEGVRVLTLLDGLSTMDLSQDSPDHGVLVDPLFAQAIDIYRGPASLLYGNTAIGGVVNTRTRFIPPLNDDDDILGVHSSFGFESQGAGWHHAQSLRYQHGPLALTASFSERDAGDISIPGNARTDLYDDLFNPMVAVPGLGEVAIENPAGTLPNSHHQAATESIGLRVGSPDSLSFGLAHSRFSTDYGIPFFFGGDSTDFFGDTSISANLQRTDARLDFSPTDGFGPFTKSSLSFGTGTYHHSENFTGRLKDEGTNFAETIFDKNTTEARFELFNGQPGSRLEGLFGIHYLTDSLDASRILTPLPTPVRLTETLQNENLGLFLNQKIRFGDFTLEAGLRREATTTALDIPDFPSSHESGSTLSHALALNFERDDFLSLDHFRLNLSTSFIKRRPTAIERYAFWENGALGRFIIGDPSLDTEQSKGAELSLNLEKFNTELSLTGFYYDFSNYIYLEDQRISFIATAAYVQTPARFYGFESSLTHHLYKNNDASRSLDLTLIADMTKGKNSRLDQPIPRMPAARIGAELSYQSPRWTFFLEARHTFEQNNVAVQPTPEFPTDAYTMVNGGFSYRPLDNPETLQVSFRLNNLLNAKARNHTSFRKDTSPLPGLGASLDLRYNF